MDKRCHRLLWTCNWCNYRTDWCRKDRNGEKVFITSRTRYRRTAADLSGINATDTPVNHLAICTARIALPAMTRAGWIISDSLLYSRQRHHAKPSHTKCTSLLSATAAAAVTASDGKTTTVYLLRRRGWMRDFD